MPVSLPRVLISFSFLIDLKEMPIDEYKQTVVAREQKYIDWKPSLLYFRHLYYFLWDHVFQGAFSFHSALFHSWRFISFMVLYFSFHSAFIWQRAFVQVFSKCRKALYHSAFTYHSALTQFI
jgi:hypothetical protein